MNYGLNKYLVICRCSGAFHVMEVCSRVTSSQNNWICRELYEIHNNDGHSVSNGKDIGQICSNFIGDIFSWIKIFIMILWQ